MISDDLFKRLCGAKRVWKSMNPNFIEVYSVEFANAVDFGKYRLCEELSKEYTRVKNFPVYFFVRRMKVRK